MDILRWNRQAWNRKVADGVRWTVPVDAEVIAAARRGDWQIILTPSRPVPAEWLGQVAGREVLCLAAGGGQQAPVLAAAGARVTVLDNSPAMLEQDEIREPSQTESTPDNDTPDVVAGEETGAGGESERGAS